jgi:opine dehydrogenase
VRAASSAEDAVAGAEAVIADVPPPDLPATVGPLVLRMRGGAVLHPQSHGYWPALRLSRRAAHVVLTDSSAPTHAGALEGATLIPHARRRGLRFSAIGGDPMPVLDRLYPGAERAASALETGLEGINLMVHPGATVGNLGALDRAAAAGAGFAFYGEGNTDAAARLAEALDEERGAVCRAHGVRHRTLPATLAALYGATGRTVREAVASCPFYAALGPLPARAPEGWARVDLPFALVPLVRLAEARGIAVPVHRGVVAVLSAAFGLDPWPAAPTLDDLGVTP